MHIAFYVFEEANEQQAKLALCQLIEQWYRAQWTVAILCSSPLEAKQLDDMLWAFDEQSFIPHAVLATNDTAPVRLCLDLSSLMPKTDVIVNLSSAPLSGIQATQLLAEIVFSEPTVQQSARERYKQYRDQGYPLKTIKIPVAKVSA